LEEKQPYYDMQATDKERFVKECQMSITDEQKQDVSNSSNGSASQQKIRDKDAPKSMYLIIQPAKLLITFFTEIITVELEKRTMMYTLP
jgi:hypothetical protein